MHWQLRDSMRERTPSADDTPKRAPPALPREASSADAVSGRGIGVEASPIVRFSSPTANNIMVASTHNLGELVLGQYRSNISEHQLIEKNQHHFHQLQHQQQQHNHHHHHHHNQNYNNSKTNHNHQSYYHQYHQHQTPVCRPGQTAQDKRSRLSNVINNLRRKVPETNRDSCEIDERNSVERNLETLEKYVMTVLNGVIKDAETEGRGRGVDGINSSDTEDTNRYNSNATKEDVRISVEDDCVNPVVNPEPSEPSAIEPAIPDCDKDVVDKCTTEIINTVEDTLKNNCEMSIIATKDFNVSLNINDVTLKHQNDVNTIVNSNNELSSSTSCIDDKLNEDIRSICRDLLNDLLNDISEAIDTPVIENEEINCGKSITMTSLHCSLPLDKVAQVLSPSIESYEAVSNVSKQISPKPSPKSTSSPTVRHLCLYCDRKFLSISLRQRHTERVHQLGGGRRSSERNSRKTIHSCQYCSDKCADNLEGLFQHMIACHTDKYHACIQCNTRYSTRETLLLHTKELHTSYDRISESLDKSKDLVVAKEPLHYSTRDVCMQRDTIQQQQQQQEKPDNGDKRSHDHELLQPTITTSTKLNMFARSADKSKDLSNLSSPDFDISFYSSVSCNIRENLLHHLDGKLQNNINKSLLLPDTKQQQQHNHQSHHDLVNPIQFPIDISLTAATPVDSKEYSANDNCDNTSEYARKAGKMSRLHPRRVSFEKYNFPRKYDGKEQWTCSINDLSKFDIYTQLTLSKKQQMIKEKNVMDRVQQQTPTFTTKSDVSQTELTNDTNEMKTIDVCFNTDKNVLVNCSSNDNNINEEINDKNKTSDITEFSCEFGNFMRLRRWDAGSSREMENSKKIVYAELTGEWSRPRIYICGACTSRHLTLKEMEEHKIFAHPNVWCSHLEFTGDQRELYKHLFLPGRSVPTIRAKNAVLNEKICTKCSKVCGTLAELHRHMLECGGDQAWLLGLFGNGKKKCKWRPFGARSRRRRQRGMKRNISNSQAAPRVNTPKEKAPSGPRVRPSDRESIQKMLANLPAKRSTRRVIQEATSRSRMRKVQTRSRPHLADNASNTRLSRKTVLRNKLLKNAKSFQRKRCRGDNISAAIESVIINYKLSDANKCTDDKKENTDDGISDNKELKRKSQLDNVKLRSSAALNPTKNIPPSKILNRVTVISKKRNVKMETRRSNLKSIGKNTAQIIEDIPSLSLSSLSTNSNVKSGKVGLKRSTKETFNVAISQVKARAQQQNASQTLSGDNITTRKRKSTDSLISLNASIKAKSQLRSQDGKFIRNKLRSDSTHGESSDTSVEATQTRNTRSDPGPLASRLRLRTVAQQRTNAELSKKMIRMSSDSDKMPTLEPVDGLVIDEDKDIEQGTNDFPILSPAILATRSSLKISNNSTIKQNDGKSRGKRGNIPPKKLDKLNKQNSNNELSIVEKDVGNCDREIGQKNRKSLRRRVSVNVEVNDLSQRHESSCGLKSHDDNSDVNRKSFKSEQLLASGNKKNLTSKVVGTRKARQERRAGSLEELSQLQQVPLEVKKLLGPKDDLFTQIGIAPTAKIRRNLRQLSLIPKHKTNITKKSNKVSNEDKDNGPITDSITSNDKSETNALRKSPRIEKKDLTDIGLLDKSIIPDKISDSIESEPSLCITNMDDQSTTNITEQTTALGRNRRRGKLSVDLDNINLMGKLPEFIKSTMAPVNCPENSDKEQQNIEHQEDNVNKEEVEMISDDNRSNSDNAIKNTVDEIPKDVVTADLVSLTLEHLQQESSNSNIDSGKENSSETPVNISKPRVTRPKKSRGFKRDRTVKRTLNNVIGILTEGVNIPVEVQQSVVLTVQTSLDNINTNIGLQNNRVEIGDNGIAASNGGGSNMDAIVNENNNDNCSSVIDDSTVNDGKSESASQELQRRANTLIEAKEEANLGVEQDVNIECSVSTVTANNSLNIELPQEPQEEEQRQSTNDIILDLSRRKPRGKGSFLEKIVSKIAKQKDAMLEGEVGSLLDHAVDELSLILGEVSPTLVDSNDTPKSSLFTADSNENKNDNEIVENKSDNSSGTNFDEELKINENSMLLNAGPSNNLLFELNSVNDNELMENIKKIDNATTGRSSKKRSLDIQTETKNKRKSVDGEEELEDNRIEEDLCLADIMKLINTAKRESPVMNELTAEKVLPAKRKTADKDCDKSNDSKSNVETPSSTSENNCKFGTIESNKKTKRSDNRKREDKIEGCSEKTRRSSSRRSNSDDNLLTEIVDNKVNLGKNVDEINSTINELNNESPAVSALTSIENDLINDNCQATAEINEKTKKSKKRSKNKKTIVKNDKLDTIDNKSAIDVNDYLNENNTIVQNDTGDVSMFDQAINQSKLITNNVREEQVAITNAEVDDKCSSPKRAFKVPEVLNTSQIVKKRGKKKSLANEHLGTVEVKIVAGQNEGSQTRDSEDNCRDESILETSGVCNTSCNGMRNDNNTENITVTVKSRRSSKRKNNDVGGSVPSARSIRENKKAIEKDIKQTDDTLIERRKTLKRKAKENIFLLDDLIDFSDEIDSPPPPNNIVDTVVEISDDKINIEKSKNEIPSDENNSIIQSTEILHDKKIEDESIASKTPINDVEIKESESAITDDASSPKKRGSGNFAVVHTKSGEILIVEKKKKFTKEVAKFFCEICTTSFTRKSSLKKHNQSQSHLIQMTKCGNDQETQDESISIDDATVSSIDRSEVTTSEEGQDIAVDTSKEETIVRKYENVFESKEEDKSEKVSTENIQAMLTTEIPSTSIIDSTDGDSTFNCPQLEEDFEDELLDEEICKITENMTHDEYVLTDHVSPMPEATSLSPLKDATDSLLESTQAIESEQQKINLSDEHLDLDSPILDTQSLHSKDIIVEKLQSELKNNSLIHTGLQHENEVYENINDNLMKSSQTKHEMQKSLSNETKIRLDFSNISEKLKINEFTLNNCKSSTAIDDFESDEDLSATNMSCDIHKLLNETELNIDEKIVETKATASDITAEISPVIQCENSSLNTETKKQLLDNEIKCGRKKKDRHADSLHVDASLKLDQDVNSKEILVESSRKLAKSNEKTKVSKSKSRMNKSLKKKLANDISSDSDYNDQEEPSSSQNKGKIVKSVFGRALTGEKIDKVKEVLDDWVSRSDSDSRDELRPSSHSCAWRNWKDERKSTHEKSTTQSRSKSSSRRKKNNSSTVNATVASSSEFNELSGHSKCRQSKKRAEERISRAFEEESIPYEFAYALEQQTTLSNQKTSTNYNKQFQNNLANTDELLKTKILNDKTDNDFIKKMHDESENINLNIKLSQPEEYLFPDTNSMESIRTRVPSCPRERSSTPDMVSLTTRDSDNDAENRTDIDDVDDNDNDNDDVEDDEEIVRGRLSPLYASNLPESSVDSVISNSTIDKSNRVGSIEETLNKRRSSSEFSGEKIIIRSTVSSEENRAGVVTIAPTDAIEDNALDMPPETEESTQKSRQGKVLNFDEELFVECCSRLKATTENELRGAKKIKLDHSEGGGGVGYRGKDDQSLRTNRGRWRDSENQNSLGSLLESVNQLLGEEMYNSRRANEHHKRERNSRCERVSPVTKIPTDFIRPDNVGYEDSLDVAFEHNNKLRDKIQQRMRESENLITTSFSHVTNDDVNNDDDHRPHHHRHHHHHQHHHHHHHHHRHSRHNEEIFDDNEREIENIKNVNQLSRSVLLESSSIENKIDSNLDDNSTMPYLLDKALSSLFHNNAKHDHNGSTPMNVLAELACAQVPTSTLSDVKFPRDKLSSRVKSLSNDVNDSASAVGFQQSIDKIDKDQPKKIRNPIKELFERKNEINDRKYHHDKSHSSISDKDCIITKSKTKKIKRHNEFPLIKNSEFDSGLVERKKRRDDRKHEAIIQDKIKDIYDFDEEESQTEHAVNSTMSYRTKNDKSNDVNCTKSKELNIGDVIIKTLAKTLDSEKSDDFTRKRLDNMIERKLQETETFVPKTKGALKAYHVEEKRQLVTGPMDEYVERRGRPRRTVEQSNKHNKSKRRSKNSKKRSRNAWYENDSSDEFVTAIKPVDIGVGISKSQRTCSKGKQNLFAELSTSSESEYEENNDVYQSNNKIINELRDRISPELADNYPQEHENHGTENWMNVTSQTESKHGIEHKKSESDMSDHPLIIDEPKDCDDEQNNSDDETDNRSEPAFELDDLYREDSSVTGSDCEENNSMIPQSNEISENNYIKDESSSKNKLIPLEKAIDLLDNSGDIEKINDNTIDLSAMPQTNSITVRDKFSGILDENDECDENIMVNEENKNEQLNIDDEQDSIELPEKLSSNEKPARKGSDNLPLHVFLSRKVQESKKRKEEQLKKMQEKEDENALMEFQSSRRQRKCAIGKQGLLAEISSSDEEYYIKDITIKRSTGDKFDNEKSRRQKRESKEKKKERYMEKKHEQIIAKEQKAIEEEILRELELKKEYNGKDDIEIKRNDKTIKDKDNGECHATVDVAIAESNNKKSSRSKKITDEPYTKDKSNKDEKFNSDTENKCNKAHSKTMGIDGVKKKTKRNSMSNTRKELQTKTAKTPKKSAKSCIKSSGTNRKSKNVHSERGRSISKDDEELRTTKSWNKVEEGVGVAIGRRKRASTNQLYYWSSSSDDDEEFIQPTPVVEEEEDDRQEQHGWIVGDSHKKMITMLAMEKQLKEKRRRSEDEFDGGKSKNKKHRNSTS